MVNAAWLRYRSQTAVWDSNPYTDVDKLVAWMLGITVEYRWYRINSIVRYSGNEIRITRDNDELVMTNEGNVALIIPEGQGVFLDNGLSVIAPNGRVLLQPGDSCRLAIPDNAIAVMLTEGNNNSIIDLCPLTP